MLHVDYNLPATILRELDVASVTIGFSIPEEDAARLQYLVVRFGQGNRSAFLRAAMKHMEVIDRAQRLDDISSYGAARLAEKGLTEEEIPQLVKRVLSGSKLA